MPDQAGGALQGVKNITMMYKEEDLQFLEGFMLIKVRSRTVGHPLKS